ncbi:MAG: oxygen-independent coproporphyrinogen III oxidase-like protein [Bordetella sp.]|nr:MAG: oxygen-independent coproporphyrinogen III oxidase-like protein [Bordetella sp.]
MYTNNIYTPIQFENYSPKKQLSWPKELPPLSIYIHVPWCIKKCPYCDFNTYVNKQNNKIPERAYLDAIRSDLEQSLPLIWGRKIISIFIGGGTPNLLSSYAIDELLNILRKLLNPPSDIEITMEANPGTVESERFEDYAKSGINRFSLGIQSFNDKHLKKIGRLHNSDQCYSAIEIAQKSVDKINIDIMFALPEQNIKECLLDIKQAIKLGINHISAYQLSIEPNTIFFKKPPKVPNNDSSANMQDIIEMELAQNSFERYEVSSYAINGNKSVHNMNYWQFGDYLGLGPGAHGKISLNGKIIRQIRLHNPNLWIKNAIIGNGNHILEERIISVNELPFEFMLNALRLKNGVETSLFYKRTGLFLTKITNKLRKACKSNLLDNDPRYLKATQMGWRYLSNLQEIFL